jgi:hypothetical protein
MDAPAAGMENSVLPRAHEWPRALGLLLVLVRGCIMEDVPRFGCLSGGGLVVVVPWWEWPESGRRIRRVCFCLSVKKKTAANLLVFTMLWKQAKRKPARRFKKSPCYQAERQENSFSNVLFQLTLAKFSRDH